MADIDASQKDGAGGVQVSQPVSALRSSRSGPRRVPARVSIVVPTITTIQDRDLTSNNIPAVSSSTRHSPDLSVTSTPWAKKLILTLDGGGIRGYSSLIILRALMKEIAQIEQTLEPPAASSAHTDRIPSGQIPPEVYREGQYLPCHYFDYLAGTSIGGIIAIMLGMMGKTADECIAEFHGQNKATPLADDHLPTVTIDLPLLSRRSTWPTKRAQSFFDTFDKFSATSTSTNHSQSSSTQSSSTTSPTDTVDSSPPDSARRGSDSSGASTMAEFKKDIYQCQVMVWCTEVKDCDGPHKKSKRIPYAFCSYKEDDDDDEEEQTVALSTNTRARASTNTTTGSNASSISIPEVAKAITTPCSPSFEPFKLGNGQFVDGSKLVHDPTLGVIKEISSLFQPDDDESDEDEGVSPTSTAPHRSLDNVKIRTRKPDPPIDLLLSLGTDEHHAWFYEKLKRPAIERNYSDRREQIHQQKDLSYLEYHRFEVQDIKLGFRKKYFLSQIEEATEKYLAESDVRENIKRYARFLVERRRARAQTSRWETFALGVKYFCHHACVEEDEENGGTKVVGCNSVRALDGFESRGEYYEHLEKSHKLRKLARKNEVDVEAELNKGRRFGCS